MARDREFDESPRKHMASGRGFPSAGDFGVGEYPGRAMLRDEVPEGEMGKTLSDHERAGPPSIHMGAHSMSATAHSHHGHHGHSHAVHRGHLPKGKRPHHI